MVLIRRQLRQRLRAEYNYIPKHVLERYCKMIRVTPHSGVLQPASSSIVTVQLKLETVDGDFLRLFGPTLSIEVRSLFLQGSSKLRWSTEALRALFRNEHSGRFAATRQTVYFLLPQRVAFTGIPERKESDGTRLVRFRPNEEVNARMRKFCAEDSLLMERIRARRANVPDVKPEVGKQEMLVPEEQEQEKDRTSFLLTVFAVAATILAAFILTTSAEGSEMRSTNY
ncbi:hypothetical protein CALVIDRAFT_535392 [Calocera viscosa TUFC12733]|uniref:Uncharacterized protein n=1 Tax=Calocera viscosa (strain TUFC12733) TaxID=1330018 RepID=A0A167P146_CALVF|nr:hypothetical protein CALVIDRAFT_535392 [Calocera viscosa TUFC12733]